MGYNGIDFNRARMAPRSGIIDPSRMGPPQVSVPGGSMRQAIVQQAMPQQSGPQSVAEILSQSPGDLRGATSSADRQRQIADMLLQGANSRQATDLVTGFSKLGEAFIARNAGKRADKAEAKRDEVASLLTQQALAGDRNALAQIVPIADLLARDDRKEEFAADNTYRDKTLDLQREGQNFDIFDRNRSFDHTVTQDQFGNDLALDQFGLEEGNLDLGWAELEARKEEARAKASGEKPENPAGLTEAEIELEVDLSNRWAPMQANFADIQQQFSRVSVLGAETKPDGTPMDDAQRAVNDLALVVAFTKMLDPGSVAREGEVELTKKSASLLGEANTWLPRLQKGGTLLPSETRAALVAAATDMMPAYERAYQKLATDNVARLNAYGLDPSRVMLGYQFAGGAPAPDNPAVGNDGVPELLRRPDQPADPFEGYMNMYLPK